VLRFQHAELGLPGSQFLLQLPVLGFEAIAAAGSQQGQNGSKNHGSFHRLFSFAAKIGNGRGGSKKLRRRMANNWQICPPRAREAMI
jgi:hypothetical protein